MTNITLSIPEDVHKSMRKFSEVRWSQVARRAIIEKIERLKIADKIASKSKLTKNDINQFNVKIKSLASKRFLE